MNSHDVIQLVVAGAAGRMGRCVLEAVAIDSRFEIAAALVAQNDSRAGTEIEVGHRRVRLANHWTPHKQSTSTQHPMTALIDFTVAVGTMHWLPVCEEFRVPMVIGSTGHDESQVAKIRRAAEYIPILMAANFSTGLRVLLRLLPQFLRGLGTDTDIEIVETHHRRKIDAPSGTAREILKSLRGNSDENADIIHGRHGATGPRNAGQIGIHSVRLGDAVGTHAIHFGLKGETITVRHTAQSREAFAVGALDAAAWLVHQPPGFYTTIDLPLPE
ncbi:MAG: 4-hydroxy-tetrahydrodipicolinate reductase [Planctomycetes bacterium]|nr:4-hydroxy-tetrahydrodipicolinate reductase [Planctomycetota bacterium]